MRDGLYSVRRDTLCLYLSLFSQILEFFPVDAFGVVKDPTSIDNSLGLIFGNQNFVTTQISIWSTYLYLYKGKLDLQVQVTFVTASSFNPNMSRQPKTKVCMLLVVIP